jgi:hypothetical protein
LSNPAPGHKPALLEPVIKGDVGALAEFRREASVPRNPARSPVPEPDRTDHRPVTRFPVSGSLVLQHERAGAARDAAADAFDADEARGIAGHVCLEERRDPWGEPLSTFTRLNARSTGRRGPSVIDTDVFSADLVPGADLADRYAPIIAGRPALFSFHIRLGAPLVSNDKIFRDVPSLALESLASCQPRTSTRAIDGRLGRLLLSGEWSGIATCRDVSEAPANARSSLAFAAQPERRLDRARRLRVPIPSPTWLASGARGRRPARRAHCTRRGDALRRATAPGQQPAPSAR